ncbi:hypothetical protein DFJ74DRAFT_496688 [Hyaloraphidium curvatum]|nr:hypothetical protein DFJ74DRAFT_496688 [Hyaloraphidium curvatum]
MPSQSGPPGPTPPLLAGPAGAEPDEPARATAGSAGPQLTAPAPSQPAPSPLAASEPEPAEDADSAAESGDAELAVPPAAEPEMSAVKVEATPLFWHAATHSAPPALPQTAAAEAPARSWDSRQISATHSAPRVATTEAPETYLLASPPGTSAHPETSATAVRRPATSLVDWVTSLPASPVSEPLPPTQTALPTWTTDAASAAETWTTAPSRPSLPPPSWLWTSSYALPTPSEWKHRPDHDPPEETETSELPTPTPTLSDWPSSTTELFTTSTIGPPAPPFPYPGRPGGGNDDYFYLQDSSVKGLYWQIVLAAIFWLAMIVVFMLGRLLGRSGRRIFATRCEVMRKETPEFFKNPIECFRKVIQVTDKEIVQNVGLDAMMFLRFLRVSFYTMAMIAMVVFPIITPINYYATIPDDDPGRPPPFISAILGHDGLRHNSTDPGRNETDPPAPPPPGNFTDPISRFASTGLVRFTIANVQPGSRLLLAHTVFTYLVAAIFFGWLYATYRDYVAVENDYMREDSKLGGAHRRRNELVQFRTVMVRDIPRGLRTDGALESYFARLGLGEVQYAVMDRRVDPDLERMIREREMVLGGLERAYVEWHTRVEDRRKGKKSFWEAVREAWDEAWRPHAASANGAGHPGSPAGQHHHEGSDSEGSASDEGESAPLTGKSRPDAPEALRPRHFVGRRFGFFGGREVDSIDFYTGRFAFLNAEIERKRKLALSPESVQYNSSGFVTFRTQRSATIASQVLLRSSTNPFTITTNLAPHPHDVVWSALNLSMHQKVVQQFCVTVLILAITFFWGIPIGFISTFTSLSSLSKVPFLKPVLDEILKIEWLNIILQTLLPPLLFRVFLALVPTIIQYIIDFEGIEARSWRELAVFDRFYTFLLFNVLFVFVLSNAVYNFIGGLFDNPISVIKLLGTVLPKGASFFTNYAVYTSSYFAWELGRPMVIMLYAWRRRNCRTPREFFQLNRETAYIDYGVYYPYHLNMLVICIVYSVQAPIILLAGMFYFGFGYLVYKHQLVYVYVKEWENHGRHWPLVFNRTVLGLIIFQLVMIGLLAVKQAPLYATAIVPLLLVTILFYTYCNRAFAKRTEFVPLDQLRREGPPNPAPPPGTAAAAAAPEPAVSAEDIGAIEVYEEATAAAMGDASPATAGPSPATPGVVETVIILPGSDAAPDQRRVQIRGAGTRGRIRAFTGDGADIGMARHRLYINPAFSSDLPQPWLPVAVVSALPASDPLSLFAPLYEDLAPEARRAAGGRTIGGVPVGAGDALERMLGSARELEELGAAEESEELAAHATEELEGDEQDEEGDDGRLGPASLGQAFVSRLSGDASRRASAANSGAVSPRIMPSPDPFGNAWDAEGEVRPLRASADGDGGSPV